MREFNQLAGGFSVCKQGFLCAMRHVGAVVLVPGGQREMIYCSDKDGTAAESTSAKAGEAGEAGEAGTAGKAGEAGEAGKASTTAAASTASTAADGTNNCSTANAARTITIVTSHKGFVKMAVRHAASMVPVYSFTETR
jgi:hypothetical protein